MILNQFNPTLRSVLILSFHHLDLPDGFLTIIFFEFRICPSQLHVGQIFLDYYYNAVQLYEMNDIFQGTHNSYETWSAGEFPVSQTVC